MDKKIVIIKTIQITTEVFEVEVKPQHCIFQSANDAIIGLTSTRNKISENITKSSEYTIMDKIE